jgi:hypothetical protein
MKNYNKLYKFDSTEFKWFLAGFIEGEGSICISIKKHPTCRFGYLIDPEFSLYQHESGKPILEAAKKFFRSGNITLKSGSKNVYVYSITSRKVLQERIIPYFKKYVLPFSCKFSFFKQYELIINRLEKKDHYNLDNFLELLDLVYSLNSSPKGAERKIELSELKSSILRDYTPKEL